ncbi:VCBS domain-containing protein [Sphaerotilaceae bacterium SBD11-9]
MATINQTINGKVTGLWGSALRRSPSGKLVALKLGDEVRQGDVILTTQDGLVEISPDTKLPRAAAVADNDIDRVIAGLNEPDERSAPAAGLNGGDGSGLQPGLRVGRISEGLDPTLTLAPADEFVAERVTETGPGSEQRLAQLAAEEPDLSVTPLAPAPPPAPNSLPTATASSATGAEDSTLPIPLAGQDADGSIASVRITALPANGTVLMADGVTPVTVGQVLTPAQAAGLLFSPSPDFNGGNVLSFVVVDNEGSTSAPASVQINVTAVNDAPVAHADSAVATEDTVLNGNVLADDNDIDSPALTVTQFSINGVTHAAGTPAVLPSGSLVIHSDGSFVFTPAANYNGPVPTATYTVSDGNLASTSTLSISVGAVNDAPIAVDDVVSTPINTPATISVLANDIDPDGDPLTVSNPVLGNPALGSVSVNASGQLVFTPAANVTGPVTITYTVSDPSGASDTATVTVNVGTNTPPTGANAVLTLGEDTSYNLQPSDFGFSDADAGQAFAGVRIDTIPAAGSLLLNGVPVASGSVVSAADIASGALVYSPAPNGNGAPYAGLSFSVQDTAGGFDTSPNILTFNVTPAADAAVIGGQTSGATVEDTALTASGSLTVTDPDAGEAAFVAQTNVAGAHGSFSIDASGAWIYTLDNTDPAVQALGQGQTLPSETFTVASIDGSTQVITVSIAGTNDAAVITGTATGSVTEDGTATASGTLSATDVDGAATFTAASATGTYGNFSINAAGAWTYTLRNGDANVQALTSAQHPTETFTVTTADGSTQLITVTVNGANEAPTATITPASGNEDTSIPVTLSGSDVDGSIASFTVTALPANGTLYYNGSPVTLGSSIPASAGSAALSFVPSANWNGSTSLSFSATDAEGASSPAVTQSITVAAVNDAPLAGDDVASTAINTPVTINVLANDSDVEGDALTVSNPVLANPAQGTVSVDASGNLVFTPANNFSGAVQISYTVTDPSGATDTANVTVNVGANTPPTGADASRSFAEDGSYTVQTGDFGFADTDAGQTLAAVRIDTLPGAGSLLLNGVAVTAGQVVAASEIAAGHLVFVPAANANGAPYAALSFSVQDNAGSFDTAPNTLSFNVTPVADTALIGGQTSGATVEDTTVIASGVLSVVDPDAGEAAFVAQTGVAGAHGSFSIDASGAWVYTLDNADPAVQALGQGQSLPSETFTVATIDGTTQVITVTISGTNDAPVATAASFSVAEDSAVVNGNLSASDADANATLSYALNGSAPAGLVFSSTGSYSFDPSNAAYQSLGAGQSQVITVPYTVTDDQGATSTAHLVITVTGTNDGPVAQPAAFSVAEDAPAVSGAVLATDLDSSASLSFALNGSAPAGLVFNASGSYSFDPSHAAYQSLGAGQSQVITVPYTVTDDQGATSTAHLVITVTGTNDAPVAQASSFTTAEDAAVVTGSVLGTDIDTGASLTYAVNGAAPAGLVFNSDGSYSFDPSHAAYQSLGVGQQAVLTVPYTVTDDQGATSSANLVITVTGTNDAPAASASSFSVAEDSAVVNGSVSATDNDANASLSYALDNAAPAGLVFNANGSYSFDPSHAAYQSLGVGQSVVLTLPYTVTDDQGATSTANLVITVTGTNDAPVATASSFSVAEDSAGVNGNLSASDADANATLSFALNGSAPAGLVFNANGSYSFDPSHAAYQSLGAGQQAVLTVPYTVTDDQGATSTANLVITVTGTNDSASIGGIVAGNVTESGGVFDSLPGTPSASGMLTVADADTGEAAFQTPASLSGTYGSFTFNAATGAWTYTLSNNHPATQALNAGDVVHDTLTVRSSDGTASQTIDVTITGSNDNPVVLGSAFGNVIEAGGTNNADAGVATASGHLTIVDLDDGESYFLPPAAGSLNGTYGSFSFDPATGDWTYTLDDSRPATQALNDGDGDVDTLSVTSADGTTTRVISVVVEGSNDAATITGTATGTVTEAGGDANGTAGVATTGGTLTVADVDSGQAGFRTPASLNGTYGSFSVNTSTGEWTYTLDDSRPATQALTAGQTVTESISVASIDGTATQVINVTVRGTNDNASIGGTATGSVTEAGGILNGTGGTPSVGGTLTVSDVDTGEAGFTSPASLNGTYGSFSFDSATGQWTYTLDNSRAATQALRAGDTAQDTLTVASLDGTASRTVRVDITGANDNASISGQTTGSVTEAGGVNNGTPGNATTSGTLAVADVDSGEAGFNAPATLAGTYGSFSFDSATGVWQYQLDNSLAATQALSAGQTVEDRLTITSTDGTGSQTVTVSIVGTNDAALITPAVVTLTETDAVLSTSGTLAITDVDSPATFAIQTNVAGSNGYGVFNVAADGHWTYTANSAHNEFAAGTTYTDTLSVTSADGTTSTITVHIAGTNDAALIAPAVVSLTEADSVLSTGGTLAITDADSPATFVAQTNVAGSAGYGHFTLATDGTWSYTTDTAHNEFAAGTTYTDTLSVTSADGTTSTITVHIAGTNDAAVITGTSTGSVTEDGSLTSTGTLAATDVDGAATFTAASATGTYGNFSINAAGAWTYTLRNGDANVQALTSAQHPTETFTVTTADGSTQLITITVNGANEAPTATITPASGNEDTSIPVTLSGSDVDGSIASFTVTALPANGTLYYNGSPVTLGSSIPASAGSAALSFVPSANWNGSTSLSFSATDAEGASSPAVTQSITVAAVNDAPLAGDDVASTAINTPVTINVLANDSDVEGDALTVSNPVLANPAQGTVSVDASGNLVFTPANNFSGAVQISYTVTDPSGATDTANVTVNVGANTPPTGADASRSFAEDGSYTVQTGDFGFADTDAGQTLAAVRIDTLPGAGSLLLNGVALTAGQVVAASEIAAGHLVFVPAANANGAPYAALSFSVQDNAGSFDTAPNTLSFNVTPVADTALITAGTGSVTEDAAVNGAGNLTTGGTLGIVDPDAGEAAFQPQSTPGTYGSFVLAADGTWSYAAANANPAIQALASGQSLSEVFTVHSVDGTPSTVTVTIRGTDDAATISGNALGNVVEAGGSANATPGTPGASGTLSASDADAGQSSFQAPSAGSLNGTYGTFTFNATTGAWTYVLDNTRPATQALNAGEQVHDTLTVQSLDGSASRVIDVTVNGSNDNASIGGTALGTVSEAGGISNGSTGTPTASGTLNVSDVDAGQAAFQAPASLAGTYGTFSFNATTGAWTYALDNTRPATQGLNAGEVVHETLTVTSLDGTATQVIDVTVNGTNDNATITGTALGSVTEAGGLNNAAGGTPTASGTLSVADVDAGQAAFQAPASLAGTYGSFTFNASTGAWTYALDNTRAATQQLTAGQQVHDTLSVQSADGTATQLIDVTVTGANDAAVIGGTAIGSVTEAGGVNNASAGTPSANGTLTVADVDAGQAGFQAPAAGSLNGTYGSFTFNPATGAWTYALDNTRPATQALIAGQVAHDTLTIASTDGSATQVIDVTVNGSNDNATISGTATGSVTEAGGLNNATAGTPTASGSLAVSDVDSGQAAFQAPASLAGTYGSFTFNASTGAWTYALDNTRPATQALTAGQQVHETLTVTSADGSASQIIDVTVNGANDSAVIGGTAIGAVTEAGGISNGSAGSPTASGALTVGDVDAGQAAFQAPASLNGTYGSFTFNASTGAWTYALDNTRPATQALNAGQAVHDTLTVQSLDGSATQVIDVTVNGADDSASIGGTSLGTVTEAGGVNNGSAGTPSATGTLTISDVDAGQAGFQAPSAGSLNGTYGTFTFDTATGAWTYALDNSRAATQALNAGQQAHDTLTITSTDGSATRLIDVTVDGSNDNATIGGTASGSVVEASGVNNAIAGVPTASGTLTVTDVDAGQAAFQAPASLNGTYGSFAFNASTGAWTYTLDDSRAATQALADGDVAHETLTVQSIDGTATQVIDIVIKGENDFASITGTTTGSVTEAGGINNASAGTPTATGTLVANDVDAGQAAFQSPASLAGTYGSFSFNAATGAWTYTLDNTRPATQALVAGQHGYDSLTVQSLDGTAAQLIQVTINGSNDNAAIGGTATGTVTEAGGVNNGTAGTPTATGTLTVTDVDTGEASFQTPTPASLNGLYGSFSFNATSGTWTYTLDNTRPATQQLTAGQQVHETLTVSSFDGSATQVIDVTVTGSNDTAIISGTAAGNVVEAGGISNGTAGTPTASGTLSVTDADAGQSGFQAPSAGSLNGTYGSFTFNAATGGWTYALDNTRPATQQLIAGQQVHDTLTVTSTDGSATQVVDVTVNGSNDNATITGTATGSVTEAGGLNNASAGTPTASGTLTVTDVDNAQAAFQAPSSLAGTYGSFTFNASTGAWTYALDNTRVATQQLTAGQQVHDTLTVQSLDGTASRVIDVTVTGANDTAVIGGTAIGAVTEAGGVNNGTAGTPTATGTLSVTDADAGQASFQTPSSLTGTYGTFTFNTATGAWTYALDNTRPATQALIAGQQAHDTLTIASTDGSATQVIDVTVNGSNDAATITGTATGNVVEAGGISNGTAGTPTASGNLAVSDVDAGQSSFQAPASLAGTYGTFTFNASTGAWTYALDNTRSATQQLIAGQQVHDTLTVTSADGTASQIIDVTVTGSNDTAVIGGTATGAVTEAGGVNNGSAGAPTATGTLSVTDVDASQAGFQTPSAGSLNGTYGSFTFSAATGTWTYTLDNTRAATQALNVGQQAHDTLTITSTDGSATRVIDVTVNGANDNATISGTAIGAVTEAGGLNNGTAGAPSANGTLSVSDVDNTGFATPSSLAGTYGSFTFNASTGAWTYTLDNTRPATQALTAGQQVHDTLSVSSADGTATQIIDVTVNGANDTASITGTAVGTVTEAGGVSNGTAGAPTATGTLSVTDVDASQAGFQTPSAGSLNGSYGSFTFNTATGAWTYALDNTRTATQQLIAGQQVHDTLTITSTDGSATRVIDVTVNGANDNATISGTATGSVTEAGGINNGTAGTPTATGTLSVTDVDSGQAAFQAPASLAGTYGSFTFNASTGAWTYTLDNTRSATQQLIGGQQVHDTLTVQSLDGTASQIIDVTVTGSNDTAVIAGTATGSVTEDVAVNGSGNIATGGTLSVTDVDSGQASFQAGTTAGTYGSFVLAANGAWTYTASNSNAAIQALGTGQTLTENFTVRSADGSSSTVAVTINGTNDAAAITPATANLTETNAVLSTGGTLSITDIDSPATFVPQSSVAGSNGYGQFTLASNGAWTYVTTTAHNEFVAGTTYTDTLTVTSADGTTSTITVNILGTNDAAVITGTATGSVTEDGTAIASGTLSATDVDSSTAFTAASATGTYGNFSINAAGAWTYTLRNGDANVQALTSAQHPTETFTVTTADGTSRVITVTVNGANEAPTATITPASGNEDTSIPVTLSGSDVDGSIASFTVTALPANGTLYYNGSPVTLGSSIPASAGSAALSFVPSANWNGSTSLSFRATDAEGASSTVVSQGITVNAVNDAPVNTVPATQTTAEDTSRAITGLSINDVDGGSGSMTVTLAVTNGTLTVTGGSATIANSGTGFVTLTGTMAQINATLASNVTYVPTANFNGTASLTMTTNDGGNTGTGGALSDVDVVSINVTAVNDAPVALADVRTTSEDTPLSMSTASLLANDTDVEGDALSIVSVQSPTHGTVAIVGGNVVFTPAANYSGPASFTYTASDGNGGTSTATVTVNVTAVADTPTLAIGATPNGGGNFTPPASTGLTQQFYDNVATVGSNNAGNIATVEANIEATTPTSTSVTTGSVDMASIGTDDAYRYTGYIYLAAGSTYTVTGSRDDTLMVKLGGSSVYSVGFNNFGNFTATAFTPAVSGYYSLEIIAYNGDGVGNLDLNLSVDGGTARDLSSANFNLYATGAAVLASGTVAGDQVVSGDGGYYAVVASGTATEAIALNPITATLRDTDGSESLAVSISAIPVGATLSDGTNSFTATAASTSTSVTGWNLSTLTLTPPASASGTYAMTVTAVATDTGGVTATSTDTISVQVNPVADTPALNVPNAVIAVGQGSGTYTVDLPVMAALRDTDGSETLTVQVSGLPSGATLNHGTSSGGVWTVASSDLDDLTLTLPSGYSNDAVNGTTLTITAVATESIGGDTATTSSTVTLFADYTTTSSTNVGSSSGTNADNYITGSNSGNTLGGGDGNDLIDGRGGNDTINGGNGNDVLSGGTGNDAIVGGDGRDRIAGGAGNDTLTGGTGSGPDNMTDVFVWALADKGTTSAPATDTITDFDNTTGRGDTLDLRDLLQGETYAMAGASGSYNGNLDHYLHFTSSGGNTTIQISSAGAFAGNGVVNGSVASNTVDQTIVLQGVDLTSGFTTDTQIINDLLTRGKLITDNG